MKSYQVKWMHRDDLCISVVETKDMYTFSEDAFKQNIDVLKILSIEIIPEVV